eukprot:GHVU01031241.1.p1 GENE.GHVU01031241.1~~GHVU01031241.1.p1  ORF type:complete len:330 (-),score=46.06 GHVU01031241.1:36-1025(-)
MKVLKGSATQIPYKVVGTNPYLPASGSMRMFVLAAPGGIVERPEKMEFHAQPGPPPKAVFDPPNAPSQSSPVLMSVDLNSQTSDQKTVTKLSVTEGGPLGYEVRLAHVGQPGGQTFYLIAREHGGEWFSKREYGYTLLNMGQSHEFALQCSGPAGTTSVLLKILYESGASSIGTYEAHARCTVKPKDNEPDYVPEPPSPPPPEPTEPAVETEPEEPERQLLSTTAIETTTENRGKPPQQYSRRANSRANNPPAPVPPPRSEEIANAEEAAKNPPSPLPVIFGMVSAGALVAGLSVAAWQWQVQREDYEGLSGHDEEEGHDDEEEDRGDD